MLKLSELNMYRVSCTLLLLVDIRWLEKKHEVNENCFHSFLSHSVAHNHTFVTGKDIFNQHLIFTSYPMTKHDKF